MSVVRNMVCPLCARPHGRPHAEGCPRDYGGEAPAVYLAGYEAGARQKSEVVALIAGRLDSGLSAAVEGQVLSEAASDLLREVFAAQGVL